MLITFLTWLGFIHKKQNTDIAGVPTSFYDFKIKTLDGKELDFKTLKGKKVLLVNTASECGYTPQYEDLEKLHRTLGGENFVVIGFPANDFGAQEPGTNKEIAEFCKKNYKVSFLMSEKISVKGPDTHPLYKWLCIKELNGMGDAEVKWNFNKFLVDEMGNWVTKLGSKTKPMDDVIVQWIKTNKKPE